MKNKDSAFIKTFPLVWIYTAVVCLVLWLILGEKIWAISFLLGSATSAWAMSLLYKSSAKVLQGDKQQAQKMAARNYAIRYFIYAIVLVVAGVYQSLEIIAVALGLFSFKLMLYVSLFIERKGENK